MICPICKGPVMEIRGEYFCSQCGNKVDLGEIEEHLKKEIVQAEREQAEVVFPKAEKGFIKAHENTIQQDFSSKEQEAASGQGETFQKSESSLASPPPADSDRSVKSPPPQSPPPQSPPPQSPPPQAKNVPFSSTQSPSLESLSPEEKILHSYARMRIILIIIVTLNILLVLSGAIYLFVFKK